LTMLPSPAAAVTAGRFAPPPWDVHTSAWQALDADLPPDHLARQIDRAVDALDLAPLYAAYAGTGSPAHPPALLLKAALYELHSGRRRPAQWHRDARESAPLRWLLRGCRPARSAWYAFRDRAADLDVLLNGQALQAAVADGLTAADRAALDGTLVAAAASRHRLLNEAALGRRLSALAEATQADATGATPAAGPPWLARTPRGRAGQRGRYRRAAARMEQAQARNAAKRAGKRKPRDRVVVSPTDPEAALGRDKQQVYRPLYNVQYAADLDAPLVLGYVVLAQPNDAGAVGPLLDRVRQTAGRQVLVALADAGYAGGADLAAAAAAGVTLYAPWQANDGTAPKKGVPQIPKEAFTWLPHEQRYRCPQGHVLEFAGQSRQRRSGTELVVLEQYRCPPEHCRACPRRQACTPNPDAGRTVSRGEHEGLIEQLRARMATPEAKALYRLRRQTVELRYADAKQHREFRRFSGRGLQRAQTEVGWTVLAYNLVSIDRLRQTAATHDTNPDNVAA
jgi:transposase